MESLFVSFFIYEANNATSPTFWIGLSDGKIFAYQMVVPQGTNRDQEDVSAVLG